MEVASWHIQIIPTIFPLHLNMVVLIHTRMLGVRILHGNSPLCKHPYTVLNLHCSLYSSSSLIVFVFGCSIYVRCAMKDPFFDIMLLRSLVEGQLFVVMYISSGF